MNEVFASTSLDRSQIIRLALFAAPYSPLFNAQLKKHLTSSLPSPIWEVTDHDFWLKQTYKKREEEKDVDEKSKNGISSSFIENKTQETSLEQIKREKKEQVTPREVSTKMRVFKNTGGVKITL